MSQTHESGDKAHWDVAVVRANGDYDTDGGLALAGDVSAVNGTLTGDLGVVGVTATGDISGVNVTASGNLITATQTPASAAAAGTAGTVTWDGDYIYVCASSGAWLRAAIATW